MPTDQLLLFIAAGLLLNLTPGPEVLYVVSHALRSGARVYAPVAVKRQFAPLLEAIISRVFWSSSG